MDLFSYLPLDENRDEIRLMTIDNVPPNELVSCSLETFSLQDYRIEYVNFISTNGLTTQPSRRTKPKWIQSKHIIDSSQVDVDDKFLGSVPTQAKFRFQWGDFAALSYVWGDQTKQKLILLNNKEVSVTANLEIALRNLSKNGVFANGYRLWVDAVCINQRDSEEHAAQLKRMGDIYSNAWAVMAWIGTADPSEYISHSFTFLRLMASLKGDQRDLLQHRSRPNEPSMGQYICAVHDLMAQEYWKRLWIFQEVILGASFTFIRLGDQIMDWETFCKGINVLYYGSNWSFKDKALKDELQSCGRPGKHGWRTRGIHIAHFDLRQLCRDREMEKKPVGFRRLLDLSNNGDCRYLRDKVFSLTGMMERPIANEVIKAYNFKPSRLFAMVTRAFIIHANNLEPLRQGNPWGPSGAPSWAADWNWSGRIRFSRPEYIPAAPIFDPSTSEPDPDTIFCAHGGIPARYEFCENWRLMRCQGFILDEVCGLGATESGSSKWDRGSVVQCRSWEGVYGGFEATARALWNMLLLSTVSVGARAQERHSALLSLPCSFRKAKPQFLQRGWNWLAEQERYYFKWRRWRRAHNDFMLGEYRLQDFFTDVIPEEADELTYMEVYCSSQRTVQQRRFLLTARGYFGWGPDDMYDVEGVHQLRVGDKIAIVFGCSTPLVIRPIDDKFQVLGEAYVQGFMNGEAIEDLEAGLHVGETFTLC